MFGKRTILFILVCGGVGFGQWVQVDSGLPISTSVACFALSGGNIFATAQGGIFLTADNGASWTAVNFCRD